MDEIRIEKLEVFAHHGVYPEERKKGQIFVVNAVLYTDFRRAAKDDELKFSTHYGEVCEYISCFMKEHTYQLIETAAEKLAQEILLSFPNLSGIELEIQKPEAPIALPFGNVSVKLRRMWHRVYLALGSNMGDREEHIRKGIDGLKKQKTVRVLRCSDLLETRPYGGVEQDDFLNGVLEIDTLSTPEELLDILHEIERSEKRERILRWGPRTLDLDILFYDREIYESDRLIIPHVDMQNRDFVLKPLSGLIPNFRHPVLHRTVSQLLNDLEEKEKHV